MLHNPSLKFSFYMSCYDHKISKIPSREKLGLYAVSWYKPPFTTHHSSEPVKFYITFLGI